MSDSLRPRELQPTRLLYPWDSSGKNTGVGCHFLLQWGWRNTAKKNHWHVWECSQGLGHAWFAPAHSACDFQIYTAQFHVLGYSTKAQTQLGLCFVPFIGLSSSGDQVLGERTLPGGRCVLSPPQSQPLGFLGVPQERHLKCAVCLLWGADL